MLSIAYAQTAHAQTPTQYINGRINGNQAGSGSQYVITASPGEGPYLHLFPNDNGSAEYQGSINSIAGYNSNNDNITGVGIAHSFQTRDAANSGRYVRLMQIMQNGKVRIGEQLPDQTLHGDYKLAVAGKIVGQSLFITRPNTWSDYVFAPTYRLRSLPEVAAYITSNQHLPDVPSADQVLRDGYDLNQMDAKLLQKIEELTLYVVQLHEKIAALEAQATKSDVKR